MADMRPIGIFDSDVGGLTVLREIQRQLPHESTMYLGDTARYPYGPKPLRQVKQFAFEIMRFFLERDVKLVVVACNTATAAALPDLRKAFPVPVVGVIRPGAEAGALASRNRKIGVVATEGTIRSRSYFDNIKDINPAAEVFERACPGWVDLVEAGRARAPETSIALRQHLDPLLGKGIDTLILGCTHYPLLREPIEDLLGPEITVVDSATTTASATRLIVEVNRLENGDDPPGHELYSTSPTSRFREVAERMFGAELPDVKSVRLS
ncbi:MAG TPA: glutamate racemase [Chloroflexota bacterium]|nr:glutamate racemase [Chloroflexota bacterium]